MDVNALIQKVRAGKGWPEVKDAVNGGLRREELMDMAMNLGLQMSATDRARANKSGALDELNRVVLRIPG